MTDSLCTCSTPLRPSGHEPEPLPPWKCLTCGGYACEYAEQGQKKCPPSICDCFIDMYPDSPRDLHPEAFVVRVTPPVGQSADYGALLALIREHKADAWDGGAVYGRASSAPDEELLADNPYRRDTPPGEGAR